jgi:2,5-diketo-D-gluconate reductase A
MRAGLGQMVTLATGTEMPALGLGTWQLTGPNTADDIEQGLELGYRLIDTSGDYGNQPQIGDALRASTLDRGEVFLVSKVEEHEDAYVSAQGNLEELGVEWLDLCLIHRPPPTGVGQPLWEGLIEAKRDGLSREIGVSNYRSEQIDRLTDATGERPVVNQIEWSPFGHNAEVREHANRNGIVIQAYGPLTRGKRLGDETLKEIGANHNKTPAQVLLRWSLQSGAAPVPKAASAAHRKENLEVFDFELGDAEVERLDGLNEHYSSLAGLPYL